MVAPEPEPAPREREERVGRGAERTGPRVRRLEQRGERRPERRLVAADRIAEEVLGRERELRLEKFAEARERRGPRVHLGVARARERQQPLPPARNKNTKT